MHRYIAAVAIALLTSASVARGQRGAPVPALPGYIKFPDKQHALMHDVPYRLPGSKRVLVIPAGFVTDFASIPPIIRPLFSHDDVHDLPGLLHDYLYWTQSCSQLQADELFREGLEEVGVEWIERLSMYIALRAFGTSAWERNAKARESKLPRVIPASHRQIPVGTRWKQYRPRLRALQVSLDTPDRFPAPYCKL